MDASIFDSALSQTRRSDASEKREKNSVSTFGRFRLRTSFDSKVTFESSPVLKSLANSNPHQVHGKTYRSGEGAESFGVAAGGSDDWAHLGKW